MITIVDSINKSAHTALLDASYELRARCFYDRLGWDVEVSDGKEKDIYDDLDPAHVISHDEQGNVAGCMRLLQTTGPHMLSDVFSALMDGEPPLRSATLWEATRFCVEMDSVRSKRLGRSVAEVTSEVMIGAFEYGMSAGITDAVAVIDPVMHRVMKISGNGPSGYVGKEKDMGKVRALAVLMDVSERRINALRDFADIRHDVFAPAPSVLGAA